MPDARRAAVDVGTNSVRLLIQDERGQRILRRMTITRLGQGVDDTGRLDDDALERTLDVLGEYRGTWEEHDVPPDRVRVGATSAIRDAEDRKRFFDGVFDITGVAAEVITGEQEAALAYLGATRAVPARHPAAVLDVGGGSTELAVGDDRGHVVASVSMQLGSVRLTERILHSDPPTPREHIAAGSEIRQRLADGFDTLTDAGADMESLASLVGVAGTVTTVAALHLGLGSYQPDRIHGSRLPAAALRTWTDRLVGMEREDRAALGPVQDGREDVIAAGAMIAAAVLDRVGLDEMIVSEADGLDGLADSVGGELPGGGTGQ